MTTPEQIAHNAKQAAWARNIVRKTPTRVYTPWNAPNPSRYYSDHTYNDWEAKTIPSRHIIHTDVDDMEWCRACWGFVLVKEVTRDPNHGIFTTQELASKLGVPAFLIVLDGEVPKYARVIHAGRQPGDLALGDMVHGEIEVALMILTVRIRHAVIEHPDASLIHEDLYRQAAALARQAGGRE